MLWQFGGKMCVMWLCLEAVWMESVGDVAVFRGRVLVMWLSLEGGFE